MRARETRCVWVAPAEEPDARYLVPGCMERVQDWDADCACKTSAEELNEFEEQAARLADDLDAARDRYQSLMSVVARDCKDAVALLKAADESYRDWRRMKAETRRANEADACRDNQPPNKEYS